MSLVPYRKITLEPEYAKKPKPEHCSVDLLIVAERMPKTAPPELNLSVDNITLELAKFTGMQGTFAAPLSSAGCPKANR